MEALRDPFSRAHPFFWPVLWLSLRAFVRWTGRMMDEGHAFAGLRIEVTWYGWIHVEAIDLSEAGKDFRRHMMGVARDDGWNVLDSAAARVDALLSPQDLLLFPETDDNRVPAFLVIAPELDAPKHKGTGPPLGPTPLPHAGRGAL
ncbi:MAG: hypothetical protein AAFX86_04140 [Pseudomonadota bacterium]